MTQDRWFAFSVAGCGLLFATSLAAIIHGNSIPQFSVSNEIAQNAALAWCSDLGVVDDAAGRSYLSLFTERYIWINIGTGLALAALTLATFLLILRTRGSPDGQWLVTPRRGRTFLMLGLAVVGWLYGSLIHSLFADLRRMLFPWCADSIAIPIFEFGIISIIASPLLALIGWAITRKFGELPARLGEWNAERPALSLVVSITFAATMVGALWLLVECLPTSASVSAPAWIMAIYLLASTRAALLSRRSPERSAS